MISIYFFSKKILNVIPNSHPAFGFLGWSYFLLSLSSSSCVYQTIVSTQIIKLYRESNEHKESFSAFRFAQNFQYSESVWFEQTNNQALFTAKKNTLPNSSCFNNGFQQGFRMSTPKAFAEWSSRKSGRSSVYIKFYNELWIPNYIFYDNFMFASRFHRLLAFNKQKAEKMEPASNQIMFGQCFESP